MSEPGERRHIATGVVGQAGEMNEVTVILPSGNRSTIRGEGIPVSSLAIALGGSIITMCQHKNSDERCGLVTKVGFDGIAYECGRIVCPMSP